MAVAGSTIDEPVVRVPAVADDPRRAAGRRAPPHRPDRVRLVRRARRARASGSPRPPARRSCARLFGVLEDRRIDDATRAHYPGARRDLDGVLAAARAAAPDEAPVEWRAALVESLQLHSLGASHDELAARVLPGLRPVLGAMLDLVGPLRSVDDSARAALAIGALLDEDLDLEGDPTYAVTQSVDVDQPGTIDPPDDRPRPDADVPRPPSSDMRQEESDQAQLGRLADVDALDPELPGRGGGPGCAGPEGRPIPCTRRATTTVTRASTSTTSGTTSPGATCRRGAASSSAGSRATIDRSSATCAGVTACSSAGCGGSWRSSGRRAGCASTTPTRATSSTSTPSSRRSSTGAPATPSTTGSTSVATGRRATWRRRSSSTSSASTSSPIPDEEALAAAAAQRRPRRR